MTSLRGILIAAVLAGATALLASITGIPGIPGNQSAYAATPPDSCFAFNAGTGTITDYYDHEANNSANPACTREVDIPSTIGGTPVTVIGSFAFYNNQLTSVTIPSSVTSIGSFAFSNNQLTSVTIPSSVTSIGTSAFQSNQLTTVTVPSSVTSIGEAAFFSNQLTSVTIPSSVTSISNGAFESNQLTSVTIPSSVTSIGTYAFSENQLTTVTIPSSVTSIGDGAFEFNQLTSVTIPSSVTSIGNSAFASNQLTSVTVPNQSATMQHNSFADNPITSMTIGATTYTEQSPTTDLACFAISGSNLTDYYQASPLVARDNGILCGRDVTIPSSVTSIGSYAFSSNQLTSFTIPSGVTSIGDWAFSSNQLTTVTIPSGVTSIGDWAFSSNQLTTVTIPSSVTSIGSYAFSSNQLTSFTIPSGVTSIGDWAFSSNQLTTVTIPSSVTSIGFAAFALQSQWGGDLSDGSNGAPNIESGDPAEVQTAFDSIWYVRLYTEDPSNPQNLQNSVLGFSEALLGVDVNNDGDTTDTFILGGHLINPASAELSYVNQSNTSLSTTQTFTGQLPDDTYLTNYYVSQGPVVPMPADPYNPTPAEQTTIDEALDAYYRIGDSVTIDPPAISGYITPESQTFVLGAADNTFSYVYEAVAGGSGTDNSNSAGEDELANTGMSTVTTVAAAGVLVLAGIVSLYRQTTNRMRYRR